MSDSAKKNDLWLITEKDGQWFLCLTGIGWVLMPDEATARLIATSHNSTRRDLDEAQHLLSKHEERIHGIVSRAAQFGEQFECDNQE